MLDEKIQQISRERLRKAEQTLGTALKFLLRNNSDYVDFAYFSEGEVNELIENATTFLDHTKAYLSGRN